MNFMSVRPTGFNEEITSSSPHTGGGGGGIATIPQLPGSSPTINDNSEDHLQLRQSGRGSTVLEKEHMFNKVVTPSDVGKLNRLVIPKQHAEKYFPLDASTNEKGLLLNFEDRNGKPWRFRYSYWNSSQSYVMTKGWSRFVKEKKLDAGDIVSFLRETGIGELRQNRLFIDWRRRQDVPDLLPSVQAAHHLSLYNRPNWNQYPQLLQSREYSPYPYITNYNYGGYSTVVKGNPCPPGSIVYLRSGATVVGGEGIGGGFFMGGDAIQPRDSQMVYESVVPVVQRKVAAKRLRLFGVNMDCPIIKSENECEILSNHNVTLQQYFPPSTITISPTSSSSSSSLAPNNSQQTRPGYGYNDEKGKGSMSLDLDM